MRNNFRKTVAVGKRIIGDGRTFIIAEIGSNYNRDPELARESISAAVENGADAVKFQSLDVSQLYHAPSRRIRDLHKLIDFDENLHFELKEYCDNRNIVFFSSPTYLKSVDILEKIDVALYKLASAQIGTFPQIVEAVAKTGKPALFSTGLTTAGQVESTVRSFLRNGNSNFVILHCNSIYPTPYEKINLKMMGIYAELYGNPVGFSDHSHGISIPIAAVALGAAVIEKHFTIDRKLKTPDSEISIEPHELKEMTDGIRATEKAIMFTPRIEIEPEEKSFKDSIIYRLFLRKGKKKGDSFVENDFVYKRSPEGIDCSQMDFIVKNMRIKKATAGGSALNWNLLEGK